MIVSFWDTLLAETKCPDYAMILPSVDGSSNDVDRFLQVKMPVASNPQIKTRSLPLNTFSLFDINQQAVDRSSANVMVSTLSVAGSEVSPTCLLNGWRTYLTLQVNS